METYNIKNVEIFAVGEHNGDKYTDKDLKEIVSGFTETYGQLKPYVKLGHNEGQNLIKTDGFPAVGWLENLRQEGKKLIVDIAKVPKKIYELIQSGAYRRISSEIFFGLKVNGKRYPKLLKAIAFLGADTPAVTNLNDIMALYKIMEFKTEEKQEVKIYEIAKQDLANITSKGGNGMEELIAMMEEMLMKLKGGDVSAEMAKSVVDKLVAKFPGKTAEPAVPAPAAPSGEIKPPLVDEEKKKLEQDLIKTTEVKASLEAKVKELSEKLLTNEVNQTVDKLIVDKKITPAQKEKVYTILMDIKTRGEVKKFKIGDKEDTLENIFLTFCQDSVLKINTETQTQVGVKPLNDEVDEEGFVNSDLAEKAKKYAQENKVSYKEALLKVAPAEK